jgi:O-antigen ligase
MTVIQGLPANPGQIKAAGGLGSLPGVATLAVVFCLYTNAAVVAVRFHGVPQVVGAAVMLLLLLPLTHYLIIHRQTLIFTPILWPIALFLGVQMIGALFSSNIGVTTQNLSTFLSEGLGLYFLLTNVIRTPEMLRRVIWSLLLAGALIGGLSVYQQVTQTYANNYWGFAQMSSAAFRTGGQNLYGDVFQPRLAGPIGEQNRYAQIMLMLVPLGLFRVWGEQRTLLRALAVVATSLISLGVALTFSRGAAVGFVLMLFSMVLLRYLKLQHLVITGLGLSLLLVALPEYSARLMSLEEVSNAAASEDGSLRSADGSTQSRVTEMLAAALIFADYPLVGVGPGMYRFYYRDYAERVGLRVHQTNRQAHNLYLGLAAETGLLGLLSFLACVGLTLFYLARSHKRWIDDRPELANLAAGLMLAVVAYMTTGLFLHLAFIRYFWLMMALAGAAIYVAQTEAQKVSASHHAVVR